MNQTSKSIIPFILVKLTYFQTKGKVSCTDRDRAFISNDSSVISNFVFILQSPKIHKSLMCTYCVMHIRKCYTTIQYIKNHGSNVQEIFFKTHTTFVWIQFYTEEQTLWNFVDGVDCVWKSGRNSCLFWWNLSEAFLQIK